MSNTASIVEALVKRLGSDLEAFAFAQGSAFASQVKAAAKTARLPSTMHAYVFWVLTEQSNNWPPMGGDLKTALRWAVFLMEESNATPNYAANFEIPEAEWEDAVESVTQTVAAWAKGPLRALLLRKYLDLLNGTKPGAARALGITPEKARSEVEGEFLTAVVRRPRWFKHPNLLYWILKPFLR